MATAMAKSQEATRCLEESALSHIHEAHEIFSKLDRDATNLGLDDTALRARMIVLLIEDILESFWAE